MDYYPIKYINELFFIIICLGKFCKMSLLLYCVRFNFLGYSLVVVNTLLFVIKLC